MRFVVKTCNTCHIEKANKYFGVNNAMPDNLSNKCKQCTSVARRKNRDDNPEVYKKQWQRNKYSKPEYAENRRLLAAYGITSIVKNFLIRKTNGSCEICGDNTKLVVDHDHDNSFVRGMLCSKCNRGIGHFDDNIELLQKAIDYLNNKKEQLLADFK